jgi:ATP-dependent helicase HrpB
VAAAERLVSEALRAGTAPTDGAWEALQGRLRFAARWVPESGLARADAASVLPLLCIGRRSLAELRAADWVAAWTAVVGTAAHRRLDALAPERLDLPGGRTARIDWTGERPVLEVRMQHLFGLRATPRVADGRVPLLLHLLAPNGRPQQVTDDLAGFWERTWPQIRKELRGRYPRHAWPENPLDLRP